MLKIILLIICLVLLSSCASILAEAILVEMIHEVNEPAGYTAEVVSEIIP